VAFFIGRRMSASIKVEHNGISYTWTGNSWIETKTFLRPPEIIIRELNRKAASQTIETDINTTDVDEILQRASNAREDGHLDQAEWLSRRALQLEPGNPGALAILCSVLRAQHQPARALRETDAYRHLSYPPLITSRAAAYCDIGEWTKAKAEIARVLAMGGGPTAFSVVYRIKQNRPELYK
jgi:hypothetical protein